MNLGNEQDHSTRPALNDRNNVDMKIVDGLIDTKISFDQPRSQPLPVLARWGCADRLGKHV